MFVLLMLGCSEIETETYEKGNSTTLAVSVEEEKNKTIETSADKIITNNDVAQKETINKTQKETKKETEKETENIVERVTQKQTEKQTQRQTEKQTMKQTAANTSNNTEYVWLSATGSKYHSINNCGKMNPAKARKITKQQAVSSGYDACSKCY